MTCGCEQRCYDDCFRRVADNVDWCGRTFDMFVCTREPGHAGWHHAHVSSRIDRCYTFGELLGAWRSFKERLSHGAGLEHYRIAERLRYRVHALKDDLELCESILAGLKDR